MKRTTLSTLDHIRVLYVEDHPVNARLMRALFGRRPDYELVLADCGRHALRVAEDSSPALLLLDLNLPDCHGSELLPLLRQVPGCETAPAVAVTADHDFALTGSGFDEIWLKPLDVKHVLQRLDAYLAVAPSTGPALVDVGLRGLKFELGRDSAAGHSA